MSLAMLRSMVLGPVSTNCYILLNKETRELFLVDPADAPLQLEQAITALSGTPVAILLTHGHFDHIGAVQALTERYNILVYACEKEEEMLGSPQINMTAYYGMPQAIKPDVLLKDGEIFRAAGFEVQMLHTPGHTVGSCCYYVKEEGLLFSGDTLFCESVGRTDFPGGSSAAIQESIHRLIRELPPETEVLPGHNEATTLAHEKRYNPFV